MGYSTPSLEFLLLPVSYFSCLFLDMPDGRSCLDHDFPHNLLLLSYRHYRFRDLISSSFLGKSSSYKLQFWSISKCLLSGIFMLLTICCVLLVKVDYVKRGMCRNLLRSLVPSQVVIQLFEGKRLAKRLVV